MTENLASTLQQQRPGKAHPKALLIGSITGAAVSITIASSMSFSTGTADTPNAEQTTTTASVETPNKFGRSTRIAHPLDAEANRAPASKRPVM